MMAVLECHKGTWERSLALTRTFGDVMLKPRPRRQTAFGWERQRIECRGNILVRTEEEGVPAAPVAQ